MSRERDERTAWPARSSLRRLAAGLREYGHHLVFILLIVSLAALTAWWAVFITQSIRATHDLSVEKLKLEARVLAARLRHEPQRSLQPGVFPADRRFELVSAFRAATNRFSIALDPAHTGLRLQPRANEMAAIERQFRLRRLMITGESVTAMLLVLGCSLLLYVYVRAERRAGREVSNFWHHLTHEVKTPITGVKIFLQSLRAGAIAGDELPALIDLALQQVETQEKLAGNLLAGSRLLGQRARPQPEVIDLDEFFTAYLNDHPLRLAGARIQLSGVAGLRTRADRGMLQLILNNLLDNALKYGPADLRLNITTEPERRRIAVVVEDNGPAFTPQQARRMFTAFKFVPAELPARRRGSGMGLYLSRRLARQMGGDLRAQSRGVACARLRLELPRA